MKKRPLRVAYVLKMFPRFSETFILGELLELERQGVRVRIFSLKQPDDGIAHGDVGLLRAPVAYVPEPPPGLLASRKHALQAKEIRAALAADPVDHVHAHFASGAASVALRLYRLTGIPYSFTAHAKDIYVETVRQDDLRRKLAAARFAVTVSDYNRRYLEPLDRGGRLVRIYNGLDLGQFSRNGAKPAEPPLLLAVGRLIEKKGFADLIRACALLRDAGVSFRCGIVGKGALEQELRRLAAELSLERHIELTGPIPRERLLGLYPTAALVAAPCVVGSDGNRDGLPTVLVEAMALGVPVVSTGVTGIPELVENGRTGILVPERSPAALAGAIRCVLEDPSGAAQRALAARERVKRQFDLHENVAELRRLFERSARS